MVALPIEHRAAWQFTQAEVWNNVYETVLTALRRGQTVATRTDDGLVYLLSSTDQIRQLSGTNDIQIRGQKSWLNIFMSTLDHWADTFGILGPTDHFQQVTEAVQDNLPVPKDVVAEFKLLAGINSSSKARSAQFTRTVNCRNIPITFTKAKPECGMALDYRMPGAARRMRINRVLAYRRFDCTWVVGVEDNDNRFAAQRMMLPNLEYQWVVYTPRGA